MYSLLIKASHLEHALSERTPSVSDKVCIFLLNVGLETQSFPYWSSAILCLQTEAGAFLILLSCCGQFYKKESTVEVLSNKF